MAGYTPLGFRLAAIDATLPGVDGFTRTIFGQRRPERAVVAFICITPMWKAVIPGSSGTPSTSGLTGSLRGC